MEDQSALIKQALPNATIRDNSLSIFAHTGSVTGEQLKTLLPLGLQDIKRSGGGITLTFKIS